jgi:2-oxo-hept-3-ene-1,7-dioate hydratase
MKHEEIVRMGEALYQAEMTHQQIDPPSVNFPYINYEEAYEIQKVFVECMQNNGMTISGKKVGLTSKAMRKTANIYEPDYGFIFSELFFPNGSLIPLGRFIAPRIECELAFKLKKDLDKPDVTLEDVIEATEYVVPCLEICDFRIFRDKVQRLVKDSIADNAAFGGYVLGDIPIYVDDLDLSLVPYAFDVNNQQVEVSCGAAVYDDPALSVAWLANTFYALHAPLKKGEIVLSGSAVASVPVHPGDYFRCRYGKYGEVACKFI